MNTEFWARSSVGEHCVDIAGVAGSIPAVPTIHFNDLASRRTSAESTLSQSCHSESQLWRVFERRLGGGIWTLFNSSRFDVP